jgi:hypothetical protein
MPRPAVDAGNVYSLVPPEARGGDGEFWGVKWCAEVGKYLAPFVMQVGSGGAAAWCAGCCPRPGLHSCGMVGLMCVVS